VTVPAGDVTLEVRNATATNHGEVLETFDATLDPGTVHTAFVIGFLDTEAVPVDAPLDVGVVVDDRREPVDANETATPTETPEPTDTPEPTTTEAPAEAQNQTAVTETPTTTETQGDPDFPL
jgi:hypothetical protein